MTKYLNRWLLWALIALGGLIALLGGIFVYEGYISVVRIVAGFLMFSGSICAVVGYYRMISIGPMIRLLTLFYLMKEVAIALVALRLIHAVIFDLTPQEPATIEFAISMGGVSLAAFFIFASGVYTLLGTIFDVFQLQVYKNPFLRTTKENN